MRTKRKREDDAESGMLQVSSEEQELLRSVLICSRKLKAELETSTSFELKLTGSAALPSLQELNTTFESLSAYQLQLNSFLIAETLESISADQKDHKSDELQDGSAETFTELTHKRRSFNFQRDKICGAVVSALEVKQCDSGQRPLCVVTVKLVHASPAASRDLREGSVTLIRCQEWKKLGLGVVFANDAISPSPGHVNLALYLGKRGVGRMEPSALVGLFLDLYFVDNIISSLRESRAIASFWREDLLSTPSTEAMERCAPAESAERPSSMRTTMWEAFTESFNTSQLLAIQTVCAAGKKSTFDDPCTLLIQGPPGTGKTRTILGIISVALAGDALGPGMYLPYMVGRNSDCMRPCYVREQHWSSSRGKRPVKSAIKVMVCAASNTAINEIVNRLMTGGIIDYDGSQRLADLKVVRVGAGANSSHDMDPAIKRRIESCTLENLVRAKHSREFNSAYGSDFKAHQRCLLEEADIICCTLSTAGIRSLDLPDMGIDVLIIDEATQAVEPSTLIPFQFQPRITVLVGDPQQLRPTVISTRASQLGYGTSLFERMLKAGHSAFMLKEQYRMHEEIVAFSNRYFYENKLQSHVSCACRKLNMHKTPQFGPLALHQVDGRQERVEKSLANLKEAQYVVDLIVEAFSNFPTDMVGRSIGVIAPYSAMRNKLVELLGNKRLQSSQLEAIQVSTIDSFQGKEKDIIILSCVRASQWKDGSSTSDGIGFLADSSRINVALTRARYALWVVGDFTFLSRENSVWRAFVEHAEGKKCVFNKATPPSLSR